jgi:hypothetical protein
VAVDRDYVKLHVASVVPGQERRPRLKATQLTPRRLIELCEDTLTLGEIRPGLLVEFGVYGLADAELTVLRVVTEPSGAG